MTTSSYSFVSHPKGQPLACPIQVPHGLIDAQRTPPCTLHIYSDSPTPFPPVPPPLSATPRARSNSTTHAHKKSRATGRPTLSLSSMADEWWSSTSHRSHGTSACSAAPPPLTVVTDKVAACGWATTSPSTAAESTSSITFQDPYRSSTHQPLSDAASSLGDPPVDWTQAFL